MEMSIPEIVKKYNAEPTAARITLLADLNGTSKEEIVKILRGQGLDIRGNYGSNKKTQKTMNMPESVYAILIDELDKKKQIVINMRKELSVLEKEIKEIDEYVKVASK